MWGGGAIIDDNGLNTLIAHSLVAPSGNGIGSITLGGTTTTTGVAALGATRLAVTSTVGLMAGMTIITNSTSVAAGATITAVNATSVTMSVASVASVSAATSVGFAFGGYVAEPMITITGGGGLFATAIGNVNTSGFLTSITVTSPGIGYSSAPSITLSGGGGFASTLVLRSALQAT